MGEATDRKVTEIDATRAQIETDLRELEERLPAPLRSAKALAGMVVASGVLTALAVRMFRSKRPDRASAEVIVRIVRDDL